MLAPLACRTASRRLLGCRGGSFLRSSPAAAASRLLSSSYPPHEVMGLPSLSPTMESGSIAAWNLKAGDTFAAGDVFCSVETDKATVDFEAQDEGVVAKILVDAGPAELKVGDPILVIVEDADDVPAFADFTVSGGAAASPPPEPAAAAPAATPAPVAATPAASTASGGTVFASPLARTLAKEKGFDISQVPGTGPVGRVLAADVQEFTPSAATAQSATSAASPTPAGSSVSAPATSSGWESSSKRNIPHYYLSVDINVESVMKLRSELSESISLYAFLIKAAAKAMEAVPAVNAAYTDAFVRQYANVDMNIEGGADGGVLTIPNCAGLGLSAIETALTATTDDDAPTAPSPGTFTLLNLGVYGVTSCAPIIREPQACALAVGAVRDLATGPVLSATLSCDHRVVDGAVGAQWLAAFRNHIENPSTLLL